jgi:hypothetical protein
VKEHFETDQKIADSQAQKRQNCSSEYGERSKGGSTNEEKPAR